MSSALSSTLFSNTSNHLKIGIIGTVNAGKTTLFNSLNHFSACYEVSMEFFNCFEIRILSKFIVINTLNRMNIVNELPWLIKHFLQPLTPISQCLVLQTSGSIGY